MSLEMTRWQTSESLGMTCTWRLVSPSPLNPDLLDGVAFKLAVKQLVAASIQTFEYEMKTPAGRLIKGYMFKDSSEFPLEPKCGVVFCHSEFSISEIDEVAPIARKLCPVGIPVLSVDIRHLGEMNVQMEHVAAGLAVLRHQVDSVALWGRSHGALAVLRCAQLDPGLAGIVLDSAYITQLGLNLSFIRDGLEGLWDLLGLKSAQPDLSFLGFGLEEPVDQVAKKCFVPALLLHGDVEKQLAPPDHARALRSSYGGEAQLVMMPNTSHTSVRSVPYIARAALFLCRAFRKDGGNEQVKNKIKSLAQLADVKMGSRESKWRATDTDVKERLESYDRRQRRQGIFLAGVNSVGAYLFAKSYQEVAMPGTWSSDGQTFFSRAEARLPDEDSQVALVFAMDRPGQGPGGLLFVAMVARDYICLSRMKVRPGTPDLEAQIYPTKAGMVAATRCNLIRFEERLGRVIGQSETMTMELTIKLEEGVAMLQVNSDVAELKLFDDGGGLDLMSKTEAAQWQTSMTFWRATFTKTVGGGPKPAPGPPAAPEPELEFETFSPAPSDDDAGHHTKIPVCCPWPEVQTFVEDVEEAPEIEEKGLRVVLEEPVRGGKPPSGFDFLVGDLGSLLSQGSKLFTAAPAGSLFDLSWSGHTDSVASEPDDISLQLQSGRDRERYTSMTSQVSQAIRYKTPSMEHMALIVRPRPAFEDDKVSTRVAAPAALAPTHSDMILAEEGHAPTRSIPATESHFQEGKPHGSTWPDESAHKMVPPTSWAHSGQLR